MDQLVTKAPVKDPPDFTYVPNVIAGWPTHSTDMRDQAHIGVSPLVVADELITNHDVTHPHTLIRSGHE